MIFLGLIIALLTWTNEGTENPLLPEYLKYQPFHYYWTVFIVLGLILSISYLYILKKKIMKKK